MTDNLKATDYGFQFGPALVTALTSIEWEKGRGEAVVIGVQTDTVNLEIYVSPKGRNVRVFQNHKELKPDVSRKAH